MTFKHKDSKTVTEAANLFAGILQKNFDNYMVGPARPVVNRVRNQFLMELLLKLPKDSLIINNCKQSILDAIVIMHQEKKYRNVTVVPEVDAL